MRQPRAWSLVEALTNSAVGYVVAVALQLLLFPLLGLPAKLDMAIVVAAAFTAASVARSYLLRRLFEGLRHARS